MSSLRPRFTLLWRLVGPALLCSLPAFANPISSDTWEALQTPDGFHVQITYYFLTEVGSSPEKISVKRAEGSALKLAQESTIERNGGSGVLTYQARQFCDCQAQVGSNAYATSVKREGEETYNDTLAVTVVDPPPEPEIVPGDEDAEAEAEEEDPYWEPGMEYDGPWPKGVDCLEWCASPAAEATDGGSSEGCAASSPEGLAFLLLLGFALAARRAIKAYASR